ncbi:MAG: rod shape-determining protein MreC [Elusimicrobia bacterium]|nr:MAG: rod shape-determining protein MreC [Elusimicrobiota bacterium]
MNRDDRVANYMLFAFSVISLVLLSLPLSGKVRSFRACVSYLLNPIPYYAGSATERIKDLPKNAARMISGDIELHEARRRLEEAQLVFEEVQTLREENSRLRLAAGLAPSGGRRLRWASILQREPMQWHRSLRVAAGAVDGVKINAPVLGLYDGRLGVVGRIIQVEERIATVLLLTDELSAVAARISQKWEGLTQGVGSARLKMNYLPVETEFEIGDEVRTSPTSAAFPAGIAIGTVSKLYESDPFLAFQSVELEPAVPASALREVLILEPITASTNAPKKPKFLPPAAPIIKKKVMKPVAVSTASIVVSSPSAPSSEGMLE